MSFKHVALNLIALICMGPGYVVLSACPTMTVG